MADKKISQLTGASTPLAGTEVLPIVQGGSTVKVSAADITAGRNVGMAGLTATGNVSLDGGSFVFNDSGADKDARFEGDTDANLLFTDASTDRVGVGTNSPSQKFSVAGTSHSTGTNAAFYAEATTGSAQCILQSSARFWAWQTSNGDASMRLRDETGAQTCLTVGTNANITANVGNIVMATAGRGIDFSANTHAAGMTSELLNWYEEGTWTPTITGSSTAGTVAYDSQVGKYTRIGRMVTVSCIVDTGTVTAAPTGDLRVAGLPFAPANTYEHVGPAVLKGIPFPASTSYVCVTTYAGETYVGFLASGSDASAAFVQADSLATDDYVRFTLTYFV